MRNYKPTKQRITFAKILVINYNKDSYKIKIHTIEEGVLKRFVEDGKQKFEVVVLPQVLNSAALQLAHEGLGHNGSPEPMLY